jgi:predicted DCC family thiol-disulfide oxidoreductase YuxK
VSEEATVPGAETDATNALRAVTPAPEPAPVGSAWTGGQWSFVRAVVGAGTIVRIVESAFANPTRNATSITVAGLGVVAAIALTLGAWTRVAAVALLALQWKTTPSWLVYNTVRDLPLLAFVLAPAAPFGSFAARGRVDPDGGWRLPALVFKISWYCIGLLALVHVVRPFLLERHATVGEQLIAVSGALFVALAPFHATRPVAWIQHFVANALLFAFLSLGEDWIDVDMSLAVLSTFLLLFDPSWFPPQRTAAPELVFFDGHCGLCHRLVRFVLAEDREGLFLFSTLQGEKIQTVLDEATRARLPDSVVVQDSQGRVLVKSAAVVHVYERLGGIWRVVALLLRMVPTALRDFGYDFVAKVRHRLFARPTESCPLMPPNLKDRFVA